MIVKPTTSLYSRISGYIDVKTLSICLFLVVVGLACIYSATIGTDIDLKRFNKQLIAASVGLVAMFIVAKIHINYLKRYSFIFYIIIMLLLLGLFLFGSEEYGTRGWYKLFGFSFQPAEFAKIALILIIANFLSKKGNNVRNIIDIGKLTIFFLCPFILIFLQPDTGTALTLLILYLGLLYWAGADLYYGFFLLAIVAMFIASLTSITSALIVAIISAIILLFFRKKIYIYAITMLIIIGVAFISNNVFDSLPVHQQNRINVFLNPESDVQGIGYNLTQAKLAIGSGGIIGKGYRQGHITQYRYVPMQYTDFIYSVLAEEFGLVGSVLVLLGLLYLCYRGITIAHQSKDIFCSLVAFGASIIMLFHIIYNIGMVLGMLPIIGIPLPFFSYGGTFLISNLIYVGLLMNINKNNYKIT
jgi:rod shape determining protein RodA